MVVSGMVSEDVNNDLARRVGVQLVGCHDHYLGLSAIAGRSQSGLFHNIHDHFWSRISGRNTKILSQVGKIVLIKAILQLLPTYAMSCFRLPDHLVRSIESMW
ncbi:hypothetical protein Sango_0800100 [Sesamum angolense]|uniref:Uncharacterized protein n=1 Tax=Sesamum angolense TaxID=2727404 RepID=A0AAE2C0K9_9LAMI|nr:hypothetical protein Sango_0800100 [Sesamum angolense]